MPLPLAGRRVAVTRGAGGEDPLSSRLRQLGAEVIEAPSITLAPPVSWDELDAAVRDLARTDWIVFASANAVERTVARAAELGVGTTALARPRLAAVGQATARRLASLVRAPDLVPSEARGEALAAALAPEVLGRRVLVPRAQEGRPELVDGLTRAGAIVVAPAAYRTIPVSPEALTPLAAALASGAVDAVAFASPSAVRSVATALGQQRSLLASATLAAIGPTTAAELRALGFAEVLLPAHASAEALADALAEHLGPRRPPETLP
jgi:uroporphyrinogen-III synthase